jgi:hypothetical protein
VKCLRNISDEYFPSDQTLAISLPTSGTSLNIETILLTDVHEDRPIVIFASKNDLISHKGSAALRCGSYIIIISSVTACEEQINRTIQSQLLHLATSSSWNPRARFVVAVLSRRLSDNELLVREILQELWKWNIVNVVILVSQKSDDQKIRFSDKESDLYFLAAYTWFPYQSQNHCTTVKDVVLLDKWLLKGNGIFAKNSNLFPSKINNFNGCPLRISARVMEPLVMKAQNISRQESNQTELLYTDGIEIKLVDVVAEAMNAVQTYVGPENSQRTLYYDLLNRTTDIAVGATILRTEYTAVADPTVIFDSDRLLWYVPCSVKIPRWMSIIKMFGPSLWLAVFASIILAVIISFCLARLRTHPELLQERQKFQKVMTISSTLWAVVLGVSVSVMPRTDSLRVFFFSWVCYSLAMSTVFQAFLTTFLTNPGYEHQISSMDDLLNSDMTFLVYEGHITFYQDDSDWKSARILNDHKECQRYTCVDEMKNVARFRNSAVLWNKYLIDYYTLEGLVDDNTGRPLLCKVPDGTVLITSDVMYVPNGSLLLDKINGIISRVTEAGLYNQWYDILNNRLKVEAQAIRIPSLADEYCDLNMTHMQSAFYFLLLGYILSLTSFLVELSSKCFTI